MAPKCAICGDEDGDMHNVADNGEPSVPKQPLHRFTVRRPKFWTYEDLVNWVSIEVELQPDETPEQAVLWWKAIQVAELMRDLSQKEMARELLGGIGPISPELITEDLQNQHADVNECGDAYAVTDEYTEEDLRDFFHVLKGERG